MKRIAIIGMGSMGSLLAAKFSLLGKPSILTEYGRFNPLVGCEVFANNRSKEHIYRCRDAGLRLLDNTTVPPTEGSTWTYFCVENIVVTGSC